MNREKFSLGDVVCYDDGMDFWIGYVCCIHQQDEYIFRANVVTYESEWRSDVECAWWDRNHLVIISKGDFK